jgi:lipoyl(octanoyl) transferase
VYTLLDLKRVNLGVRQLVTTLEQAVIDLLADYGVVSSARRDAPGV